MHHFIESVQEYGPLFAILAAVATVLSVAFTIYKTAHDRHVKALQEQIEQKDKDIIDLKKNGPAGLRQLNDQLQGQLKQANKDVQDSKANYAAAESDWMTKEATLQQERDKLRQTVQDLTAELEKSQEELSKRERTEKARTRILRKAMALEGKVWERKIVQGTPRFRPLSERHTAIISVLNLKGGVGKTTVTAHLGAALSAKGYNVLLVDLDLQGSLSGLFMHETKLVEQRKDSKLLQHFLTNTAEKREANLLEYCVPIFDGKSAIVPTADSMAYAELNLTMQWLLRIGKRDNRFLLRRGLHQKRLTSRYDIVLLDCPPLFSTCCVNALAASDYVMIPVLPSAKAAERVPLLLERLQSLHRVINPELQVMGVLLNRTRGNQLSAWENDLWQNTLSEGLDRWKMPVPAFETFIRLTTEVRDSETEFSLPTPGSELHSLFSRLVAEVEERLPRDCRRTATPVLGPG